MHLGRTGISKADFNGVRNQGANQTLGTVHRWQFLIMLDYFSKQ